MSIDQSINYGPSPTTPNDGYFDLGSYSRSVTAANGQAALWFNRGLIWMYGFNRGEAIECFNKAKEADANCAMAYWGLAHSSGAYYNKAWHLYDKKDLRISLQRSSDAAAKAHQLANNATPLEKALIAAVQKRYAQASPDSDLHSRDEEYADAMEAVHQEFGQDLDVAALCAESMMNLTPWNLWDLYTGKPTPKSRAYAIGRVLDKAFENEAAWQHPGLLHLYIHYIEMSKEPEKGIKAADCLRRLVPDGGHLSHMPSHLDVLLGDYRGAIAANRVAVVADTKFLNKRDGMNMYNFYRAHAYHSLIYAAMLCGKSQVALQNAIELEQSISDEVLRIESPPMADWLESFMAVRPHVLIRFGLWDDILRLELPSDQHLYCVTTTTIHYAQGVAHAAKGNVDQALKSQTLFGKALQLVPESRFDYPNKCVDALRVGEAMLAGEIEYRRGNFDKAFEHLRHSIYLDDHLVYSEPWGWMQPTRHAYAALLLEQGHIEEAANAYAQDLGLNDSLPRGHQHPDNIWALHGYHECLVRLGRHAEANMVGRSLKLAKAVADIPVSSSCFCRTGISEPMQNGSTQAKSCC